MFCKRIVKQKLAIGFKACYISIQLCKFLLLMCSRHVTAMQNNSTVM